MSNGLLENEVDPELVHDEETDVDGSDITIDLPDFDATQFELPDEEDTDDDEIEDGEPE